MRDIQELCHFLQTFCSSNIILKQTAEKYKTFKLKKKDLSNLKVKIRNNKC